MPAKNGLRGDLHRVPRFNNFFKGERVTRLHSAGTHISAYEVVRGARRRSRTYQGLFYVPDPKFFKGGRNASANFDIDLLEPMGMELVLQSLFRVCERIGMPWRDWSERLSVLQPPVLQIMTPTAPPHSFDSTKTTHLSPCSVGNAHSSGWGTSPVRHAIPFAFVELSSDEICI